MNLELFAAFCVAATLLILMPGPIVSLVIANSLGHGTRIGLATVAGTSVGNAMLVGAAAAGLTTLLAVLADLFDVIRVLGAAYLVWLGVKAWRAHGSGGEGELMPQRRAGPVFLQGLIIAITNPKTILFYVAFLPQFLDLTLPLAPQLVAMCVAMVIIATVFDSLYAVLAGRARNWFADPRRQRLQARITGSLLIATGIGLLLARRA